MTNEPKPHLELVRAPAPSSEELARRIDETCARIDRLTATIDDLIFRIGRLESMFPRGGPRQAA